MDTSVHNNLIAVFKKQKGFLIDTEISETKNLKVGIISSVPLTGWWKMWLCFIMTKSAASEIHRSATRYVGVNCSNLWCSAYFQ